MAAIAVSPSLLSPVAIHSTAACKGIQHPSSVLSKLGLPRQTFQKHVHSQIGSDRRVGVVCAYGDVSAEGTNYLIAGAAAVALIGTALPILFARKDMCPQCEGAGFVRSDSRLNANAATKAAQIVCPTCKGLGKLNQIDKK